MTMFASSAVSAGLLGQARRVLAEAREALDVGERFRLAHLAALRVGAAVLAERGRPASARRRLVSVWVLLEKVAPEYADWARYFAAGAPARAAVEAGALHAVSAREADDQLRAAGEFLRLVEASPAMWAAPPGTLAPPLAS
ncbi:MAG TPA: SAV_6107 family HEPN domain-containing protein [Jatrophihabitantaceae bacterium]